MYYIRDIQVGYQEVSVGPSGDVDRGFLLAVGLSVSCYAANEIYRKFGFKISNNSTFRINLRHIQAAYYNRLPYSYLRDPISREQISTDLVEIETVLFPFLDQALDIQALDKLMNGDANPRFREEMHTGFYIPHCLIVARLAGNPHFEELVAKFEELSFAGNAWGANWEAKATELPKLVKYLREEVTP